MVVKKVHFRPTNVLSQPWMHYRTKNPKNLKTKKFDFSLIWLDWFPNPMLKINPIHTELNILLYIWVYSIINYVLKNLHVLEICYLFWICSLTGVNIIFNLQCILLTIFVSYVLDVIFFYKVLICVFHSYFNVYSLSLKYQKPNQSKLNKLDLILFDLKIKLFEWSKNKT